jgi:hypothetical protein
MLRQQCEGSQSVNQLLLDEQCVTLAGDTVMRGKRAYYVSSRQCGLLAWGDCDDLHADTCFSLIERLRGLAGINQIFIKLSSMRSNLTKMLNVLGNTLGYIVLGGLTGECKCSRMTDNRSNVICVTVRDEHCGSLGSPFVKLAVEK